MNLPTAHPNPPRRFQFPDAQPLRFRAQFPAVSAPHPAQTPTATHDFLVPNPRPDLICDLQTLGMIDLW